MAVCAAALFVLAAPAMAAPPANDMRSAAEALTVPQTVSGTTVEATVESGEQFPSCTTSGIAPGSVWYHITGSGKRVALSLSTNGDLDAVLAVFTRARSEEEEIDCAKTDRSGLGVLAFKARANVDYLVLVAPRYGSEQGSFKLTAAAAADEQDFPGRRLPARGKSGTLDIARNPRDIWWVRMSAGKTYRINLAAHEGSHCVKARVIADSGNGDTVASLNCRRGYTLFTPRHGDGGRFAISVEPGKGTLASQRYHLQVGRAGFDDTGPGKVWAALTTHGHLDGGGLDAEDLYNWDLDRRAYVDLRVTGGFDVRLRSAGGKSLGCTCSDSFPKKLQPGTYFASVFATGGNSGKYTLKRIIKSITHTSIGFNGAGHALVSPGQSVAITGSVTPASPGAVTITLDRKDPVYGWQFEKQFTTSGSGGSFSVSFSPPGVGEWRAKAEFKGSHGANPSGSGYAHLSVRR